MPVPRVLWAGKQEDELRWFGVPYLIMERLPGKTYIVWEADTTYFAANPGHGAEVWLRAAEVLARLHRFDATSLRNSWEPPIDILAELRRWKRLLHAAEEPSWAAAGELLHARLLEQPPPPSSIGLVHGDFQPGNVLYSRSGDVQGVVDWELACIGPQLLDLGWLLMMGDPASWHPDWQPQQAPPAEQIIAAYQHSQPVTAEALRWYRALAGFRFGAICCFN